MRLLFAVVSAVLATTLPALAESYVNERFGTSIEFPQDVFDRPQPPADNGDGQRWLSADGAELTVFAGYNVLEQTPAEYFAELIADRKRGTRLTYSKVEDSWAVVSGYAGQDVYYEKHLFGAADETIHGVMLRYPAALKTKYDPLVGPIANSLSGP